MFSQNRKYFKCSPIFANDLRLLIDISFYFLCEYLVPVEGNFRLRPKLCKGSILQTVNCFDSLQVAILGKPPERKKSPIQESKIGDSSEGSYPQRL